MSVSAQKFQASRQSPRRPTTYVQTAAVIFKLLFPLRLMRWIVWFSLVGFISAQLLVPLFGWGWINAVTMIAMMLTAFISVITLPSQAIALASSRPVSLLGDNRRVLLIAFIVFAFVVSLVAYWSMIAAFQSSYLPSLLIVWLMVSVLLQLSVWICSIKSGAQSFIYVLNLAFGHIALWLSECHPIGVLIALVASWVLFAFWWSRWLPAKYQSNTYLLSTIEMQKQHLGGVIGVGMASGRAQTWIGSRLLGFPDGWQARSKRTLGGLAIIALFSVPFLAVMEWEKLMPIIQFGAVILLLVAAGGASQSIASSFFRNLRSIWLFSSGDRMNLFNVAWRCYLRESGPLAILLVALAMLLELLFGAWRGLEIWLLMAFSVAMIQTLIFYLVWFIYQKTEASFTWCNWVCSGVILSWLFSVCASGLVFSLPFEWQGISSLWIWLPELLAIVVLHKKVRAGFFNMDLLRVA